MPSFHRIWFYLIPEIFGLPIWYRRKQSTKRFPQVSQDQVTYKEILFFSLSSHTDFEAHTLPRNTLLNIFHIGFYLYSIITTFYFDIFLRILYTCTLFALFLCYCFPIPTLSPNFLFKFMTFSLLFYGI